MVTTLHTVLQEPNPDQRVVMKQLDILSNRFIVMTDQGQHFLEEIYGVAREKIDVIPDIPFIDSNFNKDQFGVEGKTVLLTFGLLSPNKGIEYVIEALPAILAEHPNVVYIILGATHPNLLAREGESYRIKLERLSEDRCVTSNVIFYNRFVTIGELVGAPSARSFSPTTCKNALPWPHPSMAGSPMKASITTAPLGRCARCVCGQAFAG